MIKATMGDILLLGISEINVEKLKEGLPISVELKELVDTFNMVLDWKPRKIIIFYGKTEDEMRKVLEDRMGPGTQVFDSTRRN